MRDTHTSETSPLETFAADTATPRWIRDVLRFLPVKSQFILSSNIRDRYPFPYQPGRYAPLSLPQYLAESLKLAGYERFIAFDAMEGFRPLVPQGEDQAEVHRFFKDKFEIDAGSDKKPSLEKSLKTVERMVGHREEFIAVILDFASRYCLRADSPTESEHEYFSRALMLSHSAMPHNTVRCKQARFNPIFWLCDKENDLPDWLSLDNPRLREVILPKPDHLVRRALIHAITPSLSGFAETTDADKEQHHTEFIEQTEGMRLTDLIAIAQLCRSEGLPFAEIGEAVRRFKLGVTDDPWKKLDRQKIVNGEAFIRRRVKGQQQAVTKSLDIIKRAVTGLSGSQASKVGGKPRGVMFLAGPTGVGKTELAKTLTELLFGDERAYIRFDMSEFSAEHADQRLMGAPPGYVGYDSGGELTNAIRERPFSIVLFDEIEKAHPRILDKFLQLLDDGVLTSGRGERVYFSEAVIIFTSNLGIYKPGPDGVRVPNVTPEEPYEAVERKVRVEIENYFKSTLNRPEILNRIGENIVVFDFIRREVAAQIYAKMVGNILDQVSDKQRIKITIDEAVDAILSEKCSSDLSNGGRGVGNQLEAWLINPLARALFDQAVTAGESLAITSLEERDGVPELTLGKA